MSMQGFRGNCDSQGKLGMCPSLAEPDSGGIPRSEVSNPKPQATKKFFDPAIFQKCWRGVGEQPTFAKQIENLQYGFSAAIAFFETFKFK